MAAAGGVLAPMIISRLMYGKTDIGATLNGAIAGLVSITAEPLTPSIGQAIIIGGIGEVYGWHYGFGLAGIGMLLGQLVFMWGQKYLIGVGDFIGKKDSPNKEIMNKPLTNIERDRVKVLLLSFLIVIVFWGAT